MSRCREFHFDVRVARPSGPLVVVVDRHLAETARERGGQLAARVDLAEHHVGDRIPRLDAREPRLEECRHVADDVLERERAAVEQHDRIGLPGRLDRTDQVLLLAREVERAARCRFAAHLARLTQGKHDLVRGVRHGDCLGEAGFRAAAFRIGVRRFRVGELAALGVGRAGALRVDPVEDGHGVAVAAGAPPRAQHVVLVLGQRTDHCGLLGRIERQDPALVPQQHHRAARSLPCRGDGVGAQHLRLGLRRCIRRVRVLEQAGAELHAQDPAHRVVDPPHRDPPVTQ